MVELQAGSEELVREGLLAKVGGEVSAAAKQRFGWERTLTLPTPGVIVKGCLDPCCACEPALDEEIRLDLERKQLENELLRKQIDLLEKPREYRDDGDDEEASATATALAAAAPATPATAKP